MNLEQMRARVGEILAQLEKLSTIENFTNEDAEAVNELHGEYETLKKSIEAKEKLEAVQASASTSTRKVAPAPIARAEVGVDRRTLDPKAGFTNAGDFYKAVKEASFGSVDNRLKIANAAYEKFGEDGGFLVPSDFRSEIQKKVMGDESLLSRTRQFPISANAISMPVNETSPWEGGVQAYWEGEGQLHTESKPKFGMLDLKTKKITALVKVTDELLEDATALEAFIKAEAPEAILHKVNVAIISGDGVGKPTGFLNSAFKYKVAKEVGQAADTIVFENIVNMYSHLLPRSLSRAVWLVNPAVMPQLRLMKFDASAASPVPAYMPPSGLAGAPYGTLMGLPILPMIGGVKGLGDEGDISLVDLSYYFTAFKTQGVKQDVSLHAYWDKDMVGYKFQMRLDGKVPFTSPVSTENGGFQMSGIVTLEDR